MAKRLLLALILILAISLRFWHLSTNPPSLFSDEADIGYQAFTFNRCLTDYFGNWLPSHFHSYADWQPPLYIYSVAFSQKLFGATPFTVRFPAAVFGVLTCLSFFFLIKEITGNFYFGLTGMFIATISPWLIHFSRAGFGVTGMLFCLTTGYFFWIKFTKSYHLLDLILSLVTICTSVYFYSTATLFIFFVFLSFLLVWPKAIIHIPLQTKLVVTFILIIISLPMVIDVFRGTAGYRFSYISIFSDPTTPDIVNNFRFQDIMLQSSSKVGVSPSFFSKLTHNRLTVLTTMFLRNYLSSFSFDYLFNTGDSNLRQGLGSFGYLYLLELPLLLLGIFRTKTKTDWFFLLLLLLAPIPYALTRDSVSPNATRLILMLPSLIYFTLQGIIIIANRHFYLPLVSLLYGLSLLSFVHFYFFHYPLISARSWHTGIQEAVTVAAKDPSTSVYFSNKYEPFLPFFLFYTHYAPPNNSCHIAQSINWTSSDYFTGMSTSNQRYFGQIEWPVLKTNPPLLTNSIFVVPQTEIPTVTSNISSFQTLTRITKTYPDQEEFVILKLHD